MGSGGAHGLKPRGRVHYAWPGEEDFRPDSEPYDVAVIGAGVVGCALAYKLSLHRLRAVVIERAFDVGEGTSKANSAIAHTGFDAAPGSLESRLLGIASREWPSLAEKLKVPFAAPGALLLALDAAEEGALGALHEKALANGVGDVERIGGSEARRLEPNAAPARAALLVPRESIVDPFAVSIAFAEIALGNGADFLFGAGAVAIENADAAVKTLLDGAGRRIATRFIVNAAGLGGRHVADLYGGAPFAINPRRGQFLVYDRNTRGFVDRILLPVPTPLTKGKLVAPTIFGNLLAGPTAEDLPLGAADQTWTTLDGLREVKLAAERFCPALGAHLPIAVYAGARCNCREGSYVIRVNDGHPGIVTITGIRSTGLSSSPALADHLLERMERECGLVLATDPSAVDARPESAWPGWWRRPWEDASRVAARPDYGRLVCACETVSRGEILDALDSPLAPRTLDAIKRRTRALTGRCQGFQCAIAIAEIVARRRGAPLGAVTKCGPGSAIDPAGAGRP